MTDLLILQNIQHFVKFDAAQNQYLTFFTQYLSFTSLQILSFMLEAAWIHWKLLLNQRQQIIYYYTYLNSHMKSSTISQKLNLQNIMASLKMLSQESDQSKQQIFQSYLPDDSNWSNSSMKKSNPVNKITINCNQAVLGQYCRKQVHSQWSQALQVSEVAQLKQINKKLFQDNRSLIIECIRLRKILKDSKTFPNKEQQPCFINTIQIQNLEYLNEINKLRIENLQLKIMTKGSQVYLKNDEDKKLVKHFQQIKQNLRQMSTKLEYVIEKEKNNKLSTSNTTTVASRFEETDKDRLISNIKIVYEDKIKCLQSQIQSQKQQIHRLKKFNSLKSY